MKRPNRTRTITRALWLAMTLGILMSACTAPLVAQNPHEVLQGRSVSPSQELKNAATKAYDVHRRILEQIDSACFSGSFSANINERASSETPAYKDGKSHWDLSTYSYVRGGLDTKSLFVKVKEYLESQGYSMSRNESSGTPPEIVVTAQFRNQSAVNFIDLAVSGDPKIGMIAINLVTDHFPNPPESEWPRPGEEETWKPSVPLWPDGLGPKETANPTP